MANSEAAHTTYCECSTETRRSALAPLRLTLGNPTRALGRSSATGGSLKCWTARRESIGFAWCPLAGSEHMAVRQGVRRRAFQKPSVFVRVKAVSDLRPDAYTNYHTQRTEQRTKNSSNHSTCYRVTCSGLLSSLARKRSAIAAMPSARGLRSVGAFLKVAADTCSLKVVSMFGSAFDPWN
jgi:hypothetical protein